MLKLILIFRSLLLPQATLVRINHCLSNATTMIYLFSKYYSVENKLDLSYFLKKELSMSYMIFLYKFDLLENP